MLLAQQELEHPTQVSRLRLKLFSYEPSGHDAVAGLLPAQKGFNLIEERESTASVVTSLGFYPTEEQARRRLEERAAELARQGYRPAPAPQPA
jgi:hypothetical protein